MAAQASHADEAGRLVGCVCRGAAGRAWQRQQRRASPDRVAGVRRARRDGATGALAKEPRLPKAAASVTLGGGGQSRSVGGGCATAALRGR